ncbi:MAG TPA: hypothetical protein VKN64_05065 [Halanaerobiales bacterium]|nr:hypothetical protein [Halanaerobiales bacterium]
MNEEQFNIPDIILYIILGLLIFASLSGIFREGLYQDNLFVQSAWYGTDLITFILAMPIFVISIILYKKKTLFGLLLIFAMLFYSLYNYAFYLFSAALNDMYLVYVAIFALSFYSILLLVRKINIEKVAASYKESTPTKLIGGYMVIVGILLGVFHIGLSLSYVFTDQVPAIVTNVAHPTNVIAALDLSLVVPIALIGGISLLKKQAWGYVLAVVWNFKGFIYMTALTSASVVAYMNGATTSLAELFLWVPIAVGCIIMAYISLKNIETID